MGADSDPEYSTLLGSDSYPELFVGRFSAENVDQVATQVLRTITYERDLAAAKSRHDVIAVRVRLQRSEAVGEVGGARFGWSVSAAGDMDRDGDLDLYVGNEATGNLRAPSQLFRNEGNSKMEAAQYEGAWRFSDAGADPPHGADAGARNATLALTFVGRALDLHVRRGDYWAVLYVCVDGQAANGLPRDEKGRSYLVLGLWAAANPQPSTGASSGSSMTTPLRPRSKKQAATHSAVCLWSAPSRITLAATHFTVCSRFS